MEGLVITSQWQDLLIMLSILSIAIGNVVAIAQTNLKRMLAYSTIAMLVLSCWYSLRYRKWLFRLHVLCDCLCADEPGGFGMIIALSRPVSKRTKLKTSKAE